MLNLGLFNRLARGGVLSVTFESTSVGLVVRLTSAVSDPQSWQRFVYTYGPQFVRWCHDNGLQEADALDVTQEVLLRLSRQLTRLQYDPNRSFRGWLHSVMLGTWSDWVASRRRCCPQLEKDLALEKLGELEQGRDLIARLEARYDLELYELAVARVKRRVNPVTWETFERLAFAEHSAAQVARDLGVTEGGALAARARIQRLLREEVQRLERSH